MPGVVRVFTAADVPETAAPGFMIDCVFAEGELTCCVADFVAMAGG